MANCLLFMVNFFLMATIMVSQTSFSWPLICPSFENKILNLRSLDPNEYWPGQNGRNRGVPPVRCFKLHNASKKLTYFALFENSPSSPSPDRVTCNLDLSIPNQTNTEAIFSVSPKGRFKKEIKGWEKGNLLGRGSFGTVYEGFSDNGSFFAVKEVSLLDDHGSDAKQCSFQLQQEIALLSQFEHKHIVQYYGTYKEEAKLFIFLELVTQGSLASLYKKYRLQDSQVSKYTRHILKGLNYLHERNVVHRDIKCANILVDAKGSVKLADFGLAKQITKINELRSSKGSVNWMAPEVANPETSYGPAADIWSLGCTVLEMLTRQVPYGNMEWQHVFFNLCFKGGKPPIPSSISGDARDFIDQCIQASPAERPSATQLLEHPFVRRSLTYS